MHNAAWVILFRHVPAEEQGKLMLVTASGTEIAIQCFLRIDPESVALKGRLAGSQDAGRVFFIPYSHIDYLGYQQPLKESDFHDLFGSLELPGAATVVEPPAAVPATEPAGEPEPAPATEPAAPNGKSAPGVRNPLAIKSTVLEKFRARSLTNPGTTLRPTLEE
jgi:hypothetical protein